MPDLKLTILHARTRRRVHYRLLMVLAQTCLFALSGVLAFLLRFEFSIPQEYLRGLAVGICGWIVCKSLVFSGFSLYSGWWQFVSIYDVTRIAVANAAASLLAATVISVGFGGVPRSIYMLDLLISMLATMGIRILVRLALEGFGQLKKGGDTLIYGGGAAGVMLLREIRANGLKNYSVCGFIDDDPTKQGFRIQGLWVLGNGDDLPRIAAGRQIGQVLIAIPSASKDQMSRILSCCRQAGVRFRTMPALTDFIEGRALTSQLREVAVEDLLGRTPVRLAETEIRGKVRDKVVMVTGAGGSIGSELCQQIARFHPKAIVGYEISENALFHLDRQLRESFPAVSFCPEIGSIQDEDRLDEVFELHKPAMVYHAAAYKHVPMMERHIFEAVRNNVFGTQKVAAAAARHRVEDFVMISSDKAVRPTNIMGATKRIAELLINSLQNGGTKYVSVRFGNVLGSNGSVVPLFQKQIAAGGPVTVTHPEMRRYFMTIPEAVQLVLQASTMRRGGEIFVLEMGEPVRITDLARNLILLSGHAPEEIQIVYTGIRPGEKLFEELHRAEENTLPTTHEKIRVFTGSVMDAERMEDHLRELARFCTVRDVGRLLLRIKEIVPDYSPSPEILQEAMRAQEATQDIVALAAAVGQTTPRLASSEVSA